MRRRFGLDAGFALPPLAAEQDLTDAAADQVAKRGLMAPLAFDRPVVKVPEDHVGGAQALHQCAHCLGAAMKRRPCVRCAMAGREGAQALREVRDGAA